MDSVPQQITAVIREGDPSHSRQSNSDTKGGAADSAATNGGTVEEASKKLDKETNKKKAGAKRSSGARSTKGGKKKRKPIPTDESSDSTQDGAEQSSDQDSSGDNEPDHMTVRKRTSTVKKIPKKALAQKLESRKAKVKHSKRTKASSSKPRKQADKLPDSDASESAWDSSGSDDQSDKSDDVRDSVKKTKDSNLGQETIRTQVAKEMQRILQLAHAPMPGFDPGFDRSVNYAPALGALGAYGRGGIPSLPIRSQARDNALVGLRGDDDEDEDDDDPILAGRRRRASSSPTQKQRAGHSVQGKKAKTVDYKRVDQVWDNASHNYKLQPTAESSSEAKYDGFCFHVRRTFDWEGKYKTCVVDIKSKPLRECLQDVIGNIKGVSLVDETPKLDPNTLFL